MFASSSFDFVFHRYFVSSPFFFSSSFFFSFLNFRFDSLWCFRRPPPPPPHLPSYLHRLVLLLSSGHHIFLPFVFLLIFNCSLFISGFIFIFSSFFSSFVVVFILNSSLYYLFFSVCLFLFVSLLFVSPFRFCFSH